MPTTIQIESKTVRMLRQMKEKFKLKTYDAVIQLLADRKKGARNSLLGAHPDFKPMTRFERLVSHDEEI